ncbi:MAG TPA: PHP domain-containing protein [Solirubrobacteraceae bacterium]|nr:PHP domain-containing protein [Solirubrobacteraceae bacterium]
MAFAIAQVSPHPWEARTELGVYVEGIAGELAARGHRVLIVAPSESARRAGASRRALRDARADPSALLGRDGEPGLFFAGEVLSATGRGPGLPVDVARTVEELLGVLPLDFVHVHEPFAPSTASAALRHSRALNIGSFHAPTERLLSTQVARRFVELFFGRLDARIASYAATAALMESHFPADYRVVRPMVAPSDPRRDRPERLRIAFVAQEERAALRSFLRALRRLGTGADWEATVLSAAGSSSQVPLRAELRARVRFVEPGEADRQGVLESADVVVLASGGALPAPGLALAAIGARAVPLASRLGVYEEVLAYGERGLLFEPGDVDTLAAQLARLAGDRALCDRLVAAAKPLRTALTAERVVDQLEEVYETVAARRRAPRAKRAAGGARRTLIDVDLHMHTDHSPDCATPVEVLLATAKEQGLGAIAITDHNEISGALEALAKADGIKVIVAEEIKTATQGEVIGLFLRERIPRGLGLAETVAEIRRQGGLVYVPHPFDRMHVVPGYEHLLAILDEIDAIEIFNPRVAIGSFNEEAVRFAGKYRLTAGAGSDSHVAAGLGSVRVRMRDFDGPQEFLESLRDAEIHTKPTSLLYVQALKFLETRATPQGARRARRARRVRRAMRKS